MERPHIVQFSHSRADKFLRGVLLVSVQSASRMCVTQLSYVSRILQTGAIFPPHRVQSTRERSRCAFRTLRTTRVHSKVSKREIETKGSSHTTSDFALDRAFNSVLRFEVSSLHTQLGDRRTRKVQVKLHLRNASDFLLYKCFLSNLQDSTFSHTIR